MNWTIEISLGDIINSFIGAFFGFGLTLLIELIVAKIENKNLIKRALQNLVIELNDIKDAIVNCNENDQLVIDIPIWDAFVQSGNIFQFSNEKYYILLLKTYSNIKILMELEKNVNCETKELIEMRNIVKNEIDELFRLI